MPHEERRAEAATRLREFGHEFVARDLSDEDLEEVARRTDALLDLVRAAPLRVRTVPSAALTNFKMTVPSVDAVEKHQLFTDSIVSGGA